MPHLTLTVVLTTSLAVPNTASLVDLASRAGHDAAARVFEAEQPAGLQTRCEAEADRERQVCLAEGRDDCDELRDGSLTACLAVAPSTGSEAGAQERDPGRVLKWLGITAAVVGAFMVGIGVAASSCTCADSSP